MYKKVEKPKENKSTAAANSSAKEKNSGQRRFGLEDNRPDFNNLKNINNLTASTGPMQLMTITEYDESVSEEVKIQKLLEDYTEESKREVVKDEFEKYIKDVPKDVLTGTDKEQWIKSFQLIIQQIVKGSPLPPNPYAADLEEKSLYRGTSLVSGGLYEGSAGSNRNTPCTPSAEVAALFALKAMSEGHEGVVARGTIKTIKEAGMGFSAPDTMAGQEQEITVRTSPKKLGEKLATSNIADFINALRTVGQDYRHHLSNGVPSGEGFDSLVKKAGTLSAPLSQQLNEFLKDPALIIEWDKLTSERNNIIAVLSPKVEKFERVLSKRKNTDNPHCTEVKEKHDLFTGAVKKVKTERLFSLEELNRWHSDFEKLNISAIEEDLEQKIKAYDDAEPKDETEDDDIDIFGE